MFIFTPDVGPSKNGAARPFPMKRQSHALNSKYERQQTRDVKRLLSLVLCGRLKSTAANGQVSVTARQIEWLIDIFMLLCTMLSKCSVASEWGTFSIVNSYPLYLPLFLVPGLDRRLPAHILRFCWAAFPSGRHPCCRRCCPACSWTPSLWGRSLLPSSSHAPLDLVLAGSQSSGGWHGWVEPVIVIDSKDNFYNLQG